MTGCSPRLGSEQGGRAGRRRRSPTAAHGRRSVTGRYGLLWAPELHGSACGVPAKPMEGSAWSKRHRRWPIATAASSPEKASRLNFGVCKGEGRGQGARSRSWAWDGASAAALVDCSVVGWPVHDRVGSRCGGAKQGQWR
jgi:hypothetical protein